MLALATPIRRKKVRYLTIAGHSIIVTDTEVGVLPDDQLQYSASDEGSFIRCSKGELEPPLPPPSTPSASLLEHICVNSIGDYYKIDELVTLANTKIKHLLRSNKKYPSWVPSLPPAIEAAVRSTGDDKLLDILAATTAANISTVTELDQFESMRVMTGFSMKVLRSCAQEIQTLEKAVEESRRTIELQQAQEQRSKCEIATMCGALSFLKNTSCCRNSSCDAEFQCFIDPNESILRCNKCRCRHFDRV